MECRRNGSREENACERELSGSQFCVSPLCPRPRLPQVASRVLTAHSMIVAAAAISARNLAPSSRSPYLSLRPLSLSDRAARRPRFSLRSAVRAVAMTSVPSNLRVGFAGAGMMAEALAKGFAAANVASFSNMVATDLSEARRNVFRSAGISIVETNKEVRKAVPFPSAGQLKARLACRLQLPRPAAAPSTLPLSAHFLIAAALTLARIPPLSAFLAARREERRALPVRQAVRREAAPAGGAAAAAGSRRATKRLHAPPRAGFLDESSSVCFVRRFVAGVRLSDGQEAHRVHRRRRHSCGHRRRRGAPRDLRPLNPKPASRQLDEQPMPRRRVGSPLQPPLHCRVAMPGASV